MTGTFLAGNSLPLRLSRHVKGLITLLVFIAAYATLSISPNKYKGGTAPQDLHSGRFLREQEDEDVTNNELEQADTSASHELERKIASVSFNKLTEQGHPFPHFYMHIPKVGGYYAYAKINEMLISSPQYKDLLIEDKFSFCNMVLHPVTGELKLTEKGARCNMWMSEQMYTSLLTMPEHIYTVVRNPRDHILSQYFHCTESREHLDRSMFMPSLDEWLESWVLALNNETKAQENSKFQCYSPINLQSSYTQFQPEENDSLQDLERRFTVIAPFDNMDLSMCVIFIHYAGWVPETCKCSNDRYLAEDHGVKHHGGSFETTDQQDELIQKLVQNDNLLFNYTKTLFAQKLKHTEEEYSVNLC